MIFIGAQSRAARQNHHRGLNSDTAFLFKGKSINALKLGRYFVLNFYRWQERCSFPGGCNWVPLQITASSIDGCIILQWRDTPSSTWSASWHVLYVSLFKFARHYKIEDINSMVDGVVEFLSNIYRVFHFKVEDVLHNTSSENIFQIATMAKRQNSDDYLKYNRCI